MVSSRLCFSWPDWLPCQPSWHKRRKSRGRICLPLSSGIRLALEGRRAILEKHLQPTVKDRGMNLVFHTQAGDAFLFDQVAAQNIHLFLRGMLPTTGFHGVLLPLC